MIIGPQAFRDTPARHAPAIVLGIMPHLAHWTHGTVINALKAVNADPASPSVIAALEQQSILLHGLEVVGSGAVLSGIVLASMAVFVIEARLVSAAAACLAGAVFTWFGLMHSASVGLGMSPSIVAAYALMAGAMLLARRMADRHPGDAEKMPPVEPQEKLQVLDDHVQVGAP
jgi:AGZA family xanthine/uracil permease-like MFS transporter